MTTWLKVRSIACPNSIILHLDDTVVDVVCTALHETFQNLPTNLCVHCCLFRVPTDIQLLPPIGCRDRRHTLHYFCAHVHLSNSTQHHAMTALEHQPLYLCANLCICHCQIVHPHIPVIPAMRHHHHPLQYRLRLHVDAMNDSGPPVCSLPHHFKEVRLAETADAACYSKFCSSAREKL